MTNITRIVYPVILLLSFSSLLHAKKDRICDVFISRHDFPAMCSYISLLRKADGSKWLIKQRKDTSIGGQFICIIETLGGSMAEFLGMPCNKVKLVPAHSCPKYKKFKEYPATLHTYMPGRSACYKHVNIYQPVGKRCNVLCGINEIVVKNMAQHPTLPLVVALDTFMAGTDRGCANLLYDQKTNIFYGVDFGSGFNANLAALALENFKLIERILIFNQQIVNGIALYRDALRRLMNHYPPGRLYAKLEALAREAGFFTKSYNKQKNKIKERLERHKRFINQSYASTAALVRYLDQRLPLWRAQALKK